MPMPHIVCPRCQRANPGDAVFCWFDGIVLRQAAGASRAGAAAARVRLSRRPALPHLRRTGGGLPGRMGRRPRPAAQGRLRPSTSPASAAWTSSGRPRRRRPSPTPTSPCKTSSAALPAGDPQVAGPRLDLSPRRLMLGALRAGEQRQVRITVTNQGKGLLQGKVRVSEGEEWLKIAGRGRASASCRSRRRAIRTSPSASSRAACRPARPTAAS